MKMRGTTRAGTERYHTERRILELAMRQTLLGRTRATSLRQLPTDHDHVGGPQRSIHEYQSDQPSSIICPALARVVSPICLQRSRR